MSSLLIIFLTQFKQVLRSLFFLHHALCYLKTPPKLNSFSNKHFVKCHERKKIVFCETINSSIWWLVKTLNALAKVNHWNDKHYFVTTTIIFLMRLYTANIQWQLDMTSNHLPVKQEGNIHVIAGNKECYIMQIRSSNFPLCQIWV